MEELSRSTEKNHWFTGILFAGMLLFSFYASTHMVAAGDTWVAMACGRHFSNHGVDNDEPFSFNSHPPGPSEETLANFPEWSHGLISKWHPTGWINQNWLTHLIFYKLATWFGDGDSYNYNTLVYWKFVLYGVTVLCVYATGRVLGVGPLLSAAGACLAMVVGRSFYDIRPAGYSNLLVPVLILVFSLTTYRNYRLIWLIVPVVVFWANVHGGYLYAFMMLVPFAGVHLLLRLPRRWSICIGFIGLWLLMYLMSYKFIHGQKSIIDHYFAQLQQIFGLSDERIALEIQKATDKAFGVNPDSVFLINNKMFWVWFSLAIVSLILTCLKQIKNGAFYFFQFLAGGIFFLSLIPRFMVSGSDRLPAYFASSATSSLFSFLFVFIAGTLVILAMAFKKERFVSLEIKGICHTVAAGFVAFIAMIVFNPFHLTNLTHTFEISVSKHAESWRQVNEWRPAFDWMDKTRNAENPVGHEEWFGVMCILALIIIPIWLLGCFLKPKPLNKVTRKKTPEPLEADGFEWPKIDLGIIIISLLTMYMAIKSRRFISIAGSAAAPTLAMLIYHAWLMLSARYSWAIRKTKQPLSLPKNVLSLVRILTMIGIAGLGIFWSLKFKRIYLDPWPRDGRYHSVFMRITASHLKPFEVCEFINANHITGRVFNYWTEGGAVAFGQVPDAETGKTPLKLFMDGRAQAAYNHDKFKLWQQIYSGGPVIQQAHSKKKKIDNTILKDAGEWIDSELSTHKTWVALMPQTEANSTFMKALTATGNWKTAYLDNTQRLLVNTQTTEGKALIESILNGTAKFPDTFSEKMTTANIIIETNYKKRFNEIFTLLADAFKTRPCPVAAVSLTRLKISPQYAQKVADLFDSYLDDLKNNKDNVRNADGLALRLSTANIASRYLAQVRPEQKNKYLKHAKDIEEEIKLFNKSLIW